jgi:sporulation protein YlmC with PRC-barrel domain
MARRLDAALELLDRQLIDTRGRLAGKVDDLELTDPGGNLEQPRVTAILTGPVALAGRLHTPVGRWLARVAARLLAPGHDQPFRVPLDQVEAVDSAVRLRVAADQLDTGAGPRLSELLGAGVVDGHGLTVGKVHDIRLVQARPEPEGLGPGLRVEGLLVGRRALGARFGFDRGGVRGPWLLKAVFGSLGHDGRYLPWDRVRSIQARQVYITGTPGDLPRPEPLGDAPPGTRTHRSGHPGGDRRLVSQVLLRLWRLARSGDSSRPGVDDGGWRR